MVSAPRSPGSRGTTRRGITPRAIPCRPGGDSEGAGKEGLAELPGIDRWGACGAVAASGALGNRCVWDGVLGARCDSSA